MQRMLPDGPEREALFLEAKKLFVAYACRTSCRPPHRHRCAHPWVVGYRRHPFMRDLWKYVDIDNAVKEERGA